MTRFLASAVLVAGSAAGLLFGPDLAAATEPARPTLHEWKAIEAAGGHRRWLHEQEFSHDRTLRARPDQVVVLHLESAERSSKTIRHEIPYVFAEMETFSLCIPKRDARIRSAAIEDERTGAVLARTSRGATCKPRAIPAGLYRLVVEHDGRRVKPGGEKAFVHVPRLRGARLGTEAGSSNAGGPLVTLHSPSGYLVQGSDPTHPVVSAASVDLATGGWQVVLDSKGASHLSLPRADAATTPAMVSDSASGKVVTQTGASSAYSITDLGNFESTIHWEADSSTQRPLVVGDDGALRWSSSGAATLLTTPVLYYPPGMPIPELRQGEVAISRGCRDDSHGTWIVRGSIPVANVSYSNPLLNTQEFINESTTGWSFQLGPATDVTFYEKAQYSRFLASVDSDEYCYEFGTWNSMKMNTDRQFAIEHNRCPYCDLSGIDLSGLDFSDADFEYSTFGGSDLGDTIFDRADLVATNFSDPQTIVTGTSFVDAWIDDAIFRAMDLSESDFASTEQLGVSRFSTRPDFTGATISIDNLLPRDWRWVDLTNGVILGLDTDVGTTLSTIDAPLDLSGAKLSGVSLRKVRLDGAIFGCGVDGTGGSGGSGDGEVACAELDRVDLSGASLKRAHLQQTSLHGANLNHANLDGADLSSSALNGVAPTYLSATLQGAFLRNANLASAELTGVDMSNANLFSSTSTSPCSPGLWTGKSCASLQGARLSNADFTGAYLAGADFSNATAHSARFSGAWLVGANFTKTDLSRDVSTGGRTTFENAFLGGATFSQTNVIGVTFSGAKMDKAAESFLFQLDPSYHVRFPGYTVATNSEIGCVHFSTSKGTTTPSTDSSNVCQDGSFGPCLWQFTTISGATCNGGKINYDTNWTNVSAQ